MASVQNTAPNADLFDSYFRRADLDRDGRISGLEAVSFFQASGLPKPILAKIWDYADQNRIGFLGRAEFYNALKLVTVAQSKRELTPEIVKAALFGPAAAKIPPPQMNLAALSATQSNPSVPGPPRVGAAAPPPSQSVGYRPQFPSSSNLNHRPLPSQESHLVRPPVIPQTMSASSSPPTQGFPMPGFSGAGAVRGPNSSNSGIIGDGMTGRTVGPSGTISQVASRGVSPLMSPGGFDFASPAPRAALPPRPPAPAGMMPPKPPVKDPRQLNASGNGFASGSNFGGGAFSAIQSQPRQQSPTVSAPPLPASGTQPPIRTNSLDSSQSSFSLQPGVGHLQPAQALPKQNQQVSATTPASSSSVNSRIPENSSSSQSQMPWPKMTQADVQKYTKVFVEVDKDKDGKITGGEARKLFLSWRLPIEVLKQAWDLSDQDNDSMLSHREFCVALYLMERYREGRTLPSVLPSNIVPDFPTSSQPAMGHSGGAWGPAYGQNQAMPVSSSVHTTPAPRGKPPLPPGGPPADGDHAIQKKSNVPVLEKHLVDQLSTEEQNALNSRFKEAMDADKKVEELEKEILEAKEKIEFYRVKMQELVLYKSRCDNRLNEIVERVSGDKREVETLGKKYEDKYRQTGDVASKLTIEEATFRDIQEKKMELYRAIVKIEQGGDADGAFKVRAEKIQLELDELVKALNERCKSYGLRAKPISVLELPFAWQPGIQGTAVDWDEDWDKFEDEGFTFVKELTLDVQNVIAPPKQKSPPPKVKEASKAESPNAPTSPHTDEKPDKPSSSDEQVVENGVHHDNSDTGTPKSAPGTPAARSSLGSPRDAQDYSTFAKMSPDAPVSFDKEKHSDHEVGESVVSGDKSFDEPPTLGTSDNDDVDSVWGFNGPSSSKENDYKFNDDLLFGPDFNLNPIRTGTGSPQGSGGGGFQKRSSTFFDESVPSTPMNSGFSPSYKEVGSSSVFDSSSRFDSFNLHDGGVFPQRDLSRFDSMRSSKDFDIGQGFSLGPSLSRFDSMQSSKDFDIGQGPTLSRFDSMASSKDYEGFAQHETLSRFDSLRSSKDFDHVHGFPSFDDSDPFGQTSRRASDSWGETPRQGSFDTAWGETPKQQSGFDNTWGETPRQGFNNWGETPRGETPQGSSGFSNNWGETPKASFDNWGETPRKDTDKSWSAF